MRVLCLGIDGADYDLVRDLLAQGRLPTLGRLAREGAFGPLRSTIPAFTPTAWSSFLTGLNPAGHGIFSFSTNPNRGSPKVESAASRGGTPLWRVLGGVGMRSAYVTIPFTHPPEPIAGIVVTGFGGPQRPEIVPPEARAAIRAAHPDLVAVRHPAGWWNDFPAAARALADHVEQIADVCFLALELDPDLRLLCVDFMSSDIAGHLGWRRLDPSHPAYDPSGAGDELVQVYEAVDQACGEIIEKAEWLWDEEPTTLVLSDHGMKPTHWLFRANHWLEEAGYLRYRPRAEAPAEPEVGETGEVGLRRAEGGEDEAHFAEVDFSTTRAYSYGYGGQIYLGELGGGRGDRGLERDLAAAVAEIRHPETDEQAFDVKHKEELYRGTYFDKAPELVILPRDERIHVDSSRRRWSEAFERNERGKRREETSFSGHHALTGILAASGPGIRVADVPAGSEITQMAATLLALLGLSVDADGAPIEAILDPAATPDRRQLETPAPTAVDRPVYTREEEASMIERLRDLGYE